MSKRRWGTVLCALFAAAMLLLTSCSLINDDKGRYDFEDEESGEAKAVVLSDLSEYTIIRGDLCSDEEKKALVAFRDTVNKNLGVNLSALTDWVGEGQEEREKEILIGDTNRKESINAREGLGYNDFVIKKIGSKLVIAGGSGISTIAAVDYFIENYIDIYQSTLSYPEKGYLYKQTYLVSSVTIDGKPISEYRLYTSDPEIDLTGVQKALSDTAIGAHLEIAETVSTAYNYIVFDRTGLVATEYGTKLADDGNLYICLTQAVTSLFSCFPPLFWTL